MPTTVHRRPEKSKPAWELAERYPTQGHWTEAEYLALDGSIENQRTIELVDGYLDFLPMPTVPHERIVRHLFKALDRFNDERKLGEVFFSGVKSKLREAEIRLPDLLFVFATEKSRNTEDYFLGADLVMEIVSRSPKDRRRDLMVKRKEYAQAGIREYWIVDPQLERILVLNLHGKAYKQSGEYGKGDRAQSVIVKGFSVNVDAAFAAGKA